MKSHKGIKGLEHLSGEECLTNVFRYPVGEAEDKDPVFLVLARKGGNGHKMKHRKFYLNARNNFFGACSP